MILTTFLGFVLLLFWPIISKGLPRKFSIVSLVLMAIYELSRILYHLLVVKA